jgi:hypothetical protein
VTLRHPSQYQKAIAAAMAAAVSAAVPLLQQEAEGAPWLLVPIAALVAFAGVFGVPNDTPPDEVDAADTTDETGWGWMDQGAAWDRWTGGTEDVEEGDHVPDPGLVELHEVIEWEQAPK